MSTKGTADRIMLPNFVLAGAAKSGTSFLASALAEHSAVFVPSHKECSFFAFQNCHPRFTGPQDERMNRRIITALPEYEKLFDRATCKHVTVGEASVYYLARPKSFRRMRTLLGANCKILLVLRNPADRAFSGYGHYIRDGRETLSFADAIHHEEERLAAGWQDSWGYTRMSRYAPGVQAAFDAFGPSCVRIWTYEELRDDPARLVAEAFEFIGVDPSFTARTDARVNASGAPRSKLVQRLIDERHVLKKIWQPIVPAPIRGRVVQWIQNRNLRPLAFPEDLRPYLNEGFHPDISTLSALTGRDFTPWTLS